MRNPRVPVVALGVAPHLIPASELTGFEGPSQGMLAYRLFADKRQIAKEAHPLRGTDALVARRIRRKAPWFEYSGAYWQVRRALNYVLWIGEVVVYHTLLRPPRGRLIGSSLKVFDASQYADALDTAYDDNRGAWQQVVYPSDYPTLPRLPALSSTEIGGIISGYVPLSAENTVVSRTPARPDDPRGLRVYTALYRALRDYPDLRVCEPPRHIAKLILSFWDDSYHQPVTGERTWLLGLTEDGIALRIRSKARNRFDFPLWVCGEAINRAFADEVFFRPAG